MKTSSHSQMETWTQCPQRWHLERIDRAPRAPATALILGDAFHQAIEADGQAYLDGRPRLTLGELIEIGSYALGERQALDDQQGLITRADTEDMVLRLNAMLDAYVAHIQSAYQPTAVERELTAPLAGTDGWQFVGRVDALTERGIVDFKTASKPWQVGAEHHKPQATAYYWLCAEVDNDEGWEWTPQQCTFLVFSTTRGEDGAYTCAVERRVTTRTPEQIVVWAYTAAATAREMMDAEQTGTYPAKPGPLCGWCGVLWSCEVGMAWLRERGRTPAVPVLPA